jgi:hypothetical protein
VVAALPIVLRIVLRLAVARGLLGLERVICHAANVLLDEPLDASEVGALFVITK